jgi:pilus assembly protein Flp/PilA
MRATFSAFIEDESGLTMIEYALVAGLVSIVIVSMLGRLGTNLANWFMSISGELVAAAG